MSSGLPKTVLFSSNLVSFLPGVSKEDRADILDVLLLAELSASEQYSREKNWQQWIDVYKSVLVGSGITSRNSLSQNPVKVSNQSGFRREAGKLVKTISPPGLARVAEAALDAMFNSTHAQQFFSSWFNFNSGRSDNFQVVPCEKASSDEVNVAVCGLQMVTRTTVRPPNGFWPEWPFKYEMTLTLRGGGYVYSASRYAPHRERVGEALRSRGAQAIEAIEL
jgi:hypothetical protein